MTATPRPATSATASLASVPEGVRVLDLSPHADERGVLTELFRSDWDHEFAPVQWNVVHSEADTLRGVHCHPRHTDYLTVVAGSLLLGLCDLRVGTDPDRRSAVVTLPALTVAVVIPPGVAHGFYFADRASFVYGVSHAFDRADELGCRWDDPALGLVWEATDPMLSERDRDAGSCAELTAVVRASLARLAT